MTDIIVKSIDLVAHTYIDKNDVEQQIKANTACLVPKKDGTTEHNSYVTDENGIVSKQTSIPLPPTTGSYVLMSIEGVMTWVDPDPVIYTQTGN